MLVVISPAKRLNWDEVPEIAMTEPVFLSDAASLAGTARRLSKPKLAALMGLSDTLAKLNKDRFASFDDEPSTDLIRPAVRAFAGDTYLGLEAATLDTEELKWAQDHLRILSGLYGVLRPFDGIQAYRLEMGSRLSTRKGRNLYEYWGDRISTALGEAGSEIGTDTLINCASQEYFGAVPTGALPLRVVTPVFMEEKPGGPKIVSFFAKKARGAMARYIIQRRLTDPEALTEFETGGYTFWPDLSQQDRPVFVRSEAAQAAA